MVARSRFSFSKLAFAVAGALALVVGTDAAGAVLPAPPPDPPVRVIVQLWDGLDAAPRTAVANLGGAVTGNLAVVNGFSATLPSSAVASLAANPGVRVVSLDAPVLTQGTMADGGAPSVYREVVRADAASAAGRRGAGVTVAVIDTGIAPTGPLADRLLTVDGGAQCVNLSPEPGCADSYGHGTFIAGLVNGVAPDANLLALKLSGRDGTSDVSRLLTAIDWVLVNKDRYNVKVVNLSVRTYSPLSYRTDPVNLAVERLWAAGVLVSVSAGNQGPGASSIAKPADDPWVVTTGSIDDHGTVSLADDAVSDFSSRGPSIPDGVAKPDVVVPGRSLVSLRSPGSEADLRHPYFVDATQRRGSGTSFSTGITSGAAAVLLAADPTATNDRVKFALMSSGRAVPGADASAAGSGVFDLEAAAGAPPGEANKQRFHPLFWPLRGPTSLTDVAGSLFEPAWWQGSNWQGSNWQGSNWQGSNWQGSNWQGSNWQGSNWQGSNWQGSNWQGSNWQGSNWQGSNWQASYWS
ncbi:MAG: serine protease AprX [Actinomycetota bacterium]|jgi:serine protease AprX|nr:serine protease AprX [Actinomycetota bacterium]